MGRRNERSDPPPHRERRVGSPPHGLHDFCPLRLLAHALLVPIPFLRGFATPPGVLPAGCSFRRPGGPSCAMDVRWRPFCLHLQQDFARKASARLRALFGRSPDTLWGSFRTTFEPSGAPLGPYWAPFGPFRTPSETSSKQVLPKTCRNQKPSKTYRKLLISAVSASFCAPFGALLQPPAALLEPPLPLWSISKASRAVLTVSRTHLGPSDRPFGALPGRFRRANGGPRRCL
eukprot:7542347-Pyramimonas_sp.AAC.1